METNQLSFSDIINVFKKNNKSILTYTFIVSFIAAILTLFMPNYYVSKAYFYVNNSENLNPKYSFSNEVAPFFAEESDIERIKLIVKSKQFQDQIIKEYNLLSYFNIDTTDRINYAKVYRKVNKMISLTKDESESLILEVEHKDPDVASKIANSSLYILENINAGIIASFLKEQKKLIEFQVKENTSKLTERENKLSAIKKEHHIVVKSVGTDNESMNFSPEEIKFKKEFSNGIDKFVLNRENYMNTSNSTVLIENYETQYKTIVDLIEKKELKTFTIIEQAYPNYIKDNPKRSLIVIGIFIFSIVSFTLVYTTNTKKN